jgi:hypothetical protein
VVVRWKLRQHAAIFIDYKGIALQGFLKGLEKTKTFAVNSENKYS